MAISIDRRVSRDGAFPNGISVAAVVRFVLDYEATARVEDVADYFDLEVDDVVAALAYYEQHRDRILRDLEASDDARPAFGAGAPARDHHPRTSRWQRRRGTAVDLR
jgi:hypothetical protein